MKEFLRKPLIYLLAVMMVLPTWLVTGVTGVEKTQAAPDDARNVVINEINWAGSSKSDYDEWIELRNMTSNTIDLSGWTISHAASSAGTLTIPDGQSIAPNGYFLISHYAKSSSSSALNVDPNWVVNSISLLNNETNDLVLKHGIIVEDTARALAAGNNDWNRSTFSNNRFSMARKLVPGDGALTSSWFTSDFARGYDNNSGTYDRGTPGSGNGAVITLGSYQTTPTNIDVNVTASTDHGTLNAVSHTFTANGNYDFTVTTAAGTVTKTVNITNIDKIVPTATVNYSAITPTNQNVVATLTPSEPVTITNNGGSASYIFSENGAFTFNFTDLAGNVGNVVATVTNIDKVAPEQPVVNPVVSPINAGTEKISGTAESFSTVKISDGINNYSQVVDGAGVYDITVNLSRDADNIFSVTATDIAGNTSLPTNVTIKEDSTAPVISIIKNPTDDISKVNYTVKIEYSADSVAKIYSLDNGAWSSYTNPITISDEGIHTITAMGTDGAGNYSTSSSTFTLDKTAPTVLELPDVTMTDESPVTIVATDLSSLNYSMSENYGPGDLTFTQDTTDPATFKIKANVNGDYTVYAMATDAAGNSNYVHFKLTWIQKYNITPENPTLTLTRGTGDGEIIVDPATEKPVLDLSNFLGTKVSEDGSETIVASLQDLTLKVKTVIDGVSVTFDLGERGIGEEYVQTDISGPEGWDGTINLAVPTVIDNSLLLTKSQNIATDILAIESGLENGSLEFLPAIKITFTEKAGQRVGFIKDGKFEEITQICGDVDDRMPLDSNECRLEIEGNKDLVIYTNHLTTFVTYMESNVPAPIFTASKVVKNNENFIHVEWTGNGADYYLVKINGVTTKIFAKSASDTKYSYDVKVAEYAKYSVLVTAMKVNVESINSSAVIVEFTPTVAPVITAQAPAETAPVTIAPQKAAAAKNPAPAENKAQTPNDDNGIIKGSDTTDDAKDEINWTPWIVLFILIILAGAATGGYFYWFADKDKSSEENKVLTETKKEDKKTETPKVTVTTSSKTKKKSKRW